MWPVELTAVTAMSAAAKPVTSSLNVTAYWKGVVLVRVLLASGEDIVGAGPVVSGGGGSIRMAGPTPPVDVPPDEGAGAAVTVIGGHRDGLLGDFASIFSDGVAVTVIGRHRDSSMPLPAMSNTAPASMSSRGSRIATMAAARFRSSVKVRVSSSRTGSGSPESGTVEIVPASRTRTSSARTVPLRGSLKDMTRVRSDLSKVAPIMTGGGRSPSQSIWRTRLEAAAAQVEPAASKTSTAVEARDVTFPKACTPLGAAWSVTFTTWTPSSAATTA